MLQVRIPLYLKFLHVDDFAIVELIYIYLNRKISHDVINSIFGVFTKIFTVRKLSQNSVDSVLSYWQQI